MIHSYWAIFAELIATPFGHVTLVWGIVPLYFGLLLNELTSAKANFRTALQTGFSFLWAGAQWLYLYYPAHLPSRPPIELGAVPINLFVTFLVLAIGAMALFCGLHRRFPKYASLVRHTPFAH